MIKRLSPGTTQFLGEDDRELWNVRRLTNANFGKGLSWTTNPFVAADVRRLTLCLEGGAPREK
jgi:hypothetical protein